MKLEEVLTKTKNHFQKLGIESFRLDAETLISSALGWKRLDLYLKPEYPMNENEVSICREFVRRRSKGEPVAYILGEKEFYSIPIKVNPSVLIPRPETEHIVDEVKDSFQNKEQELKILDLGSGSGCISIALASVFPNAQVYGVELSSEACSLARENAETNLVADRVQFVNKDVLDVTENDFTMLFDVVVSNPPYIDIADQNTADDVRKFEPDSALFAKDNGLYCYKNWIKKLPSLTKSDSLTVWEIGFQQAAEVKEIFLSSNIFKDINVKQDYSGHDRILTARLK